MSIKTIRRNLDALAAHIERVEDPNFVQQGYSGFVGVAQQVNMRTLGRGVNVSPSNYSGLVVYYEILLRRVKDFVEEQNLALGIKAKCRIPNSQAKCAWVDLSGTVYGAEFYRATPAGLQAIQTLASGICRLVQANATDEVLAAEEGIAHGGDVVRLLEAAEVAVMSAKVVLEFIANCVEYGFHQHLFSLFEDPRVNTVSRLVHLVVKNQSTSELTRAAMKATQSANIKARDREDQRHRKEMVKLMDVLNPVEMVVTVDAEPVVEAAPKKASPRKAKVTAPVEDTVAEEVIAVAIEEVTKKRSKAAPVAPQSVDEIFQTASETPVVHRPRKGRR